MIKDEEVDEVEVCLSPLMINLLERAHDEAFKTMVEQMKINPDAIEALYG